MQYPFLTSSRTRPHHLIVGQEGENLAVSYLKSIGYSVRERNIRVGSDEIDILAHDPEDDVLVFAEVKARTKKIGEGYHPELMAVGEKRRRMRRAVRRWVANHDYDGGYRMDLICVQENRVTNHFKELSWD